MTLRFYQWGDFYDGNRTEWFIRSTFQLNNHISLRTDFTQNYIDLPEGSFTVNEFGARVEMSISPNLFGAFFGQWNNSDQIALINFRINWIPTPGTNFYFVIDQSIDMHSGDWKMTDTTVLSKLIWRFVL
ncbi:MAG TPA: hypothetical protein EYP36_04130 [Calditrichaeota bacterium]|nr:hypothetical protein [Calditrichota bacterium]